MKVYTCAHLKWDRSQSTTFTPNTEWERPLLLCSAHAMLHRKGVSFMVYPLKGQ